jgi:predicted regulator of Ras-like GTPase activity (Roadblock/LC7/MglB family)
MAQLDFQPQMIGRENELKELHEHMSKASQGSGTTLFISGEAGIGKTRLLEEIKNTAESKGFQIMSGNSLYESLTPYMPFLEALRSGGMESLFAEEAPRVEAVYLVTNTGLLVKEVLRKETELDPDLFASMLTTVGDFVKDSLSMLSGEEREGMLNSVGYENHRILIEGGKDTNLAVILTGRENEFLINDIRDILVKVQKNHGDVLRQWDGDEESVRGIEDTLLPLVASGKYDGVYFGLQAKESPVRECLIGPLSTGGDRANPALHRGPPLGGSLFPCTDALHGENHEEVQSSSHRHLQTRGHRFEGRQDTPSGRHHADDEPGGPMRKNRAGEIASGERI